VKPTPNIWLPALLMVVFVLTRWPGVMPSNFSAAYALLFCAGVYFPARLAWWLPLTTMAVADVGLAFYYWKFHGIAPQSYQLMNYVVYLGIIGLGRLFRPSHSWTRLLGGGVLGALLFYLLTNTASWLLNPFGNPEYTKDLAGWWRALTQGTAGHPPTWEFLRNTLLSGGLFTGLFVGAMKGADQMESAVEKALAEAQVDDSEEPTAEPRPEAEETRA
jgi:hypothetical protein